MCIFTGSVERVASTRIFARAEGEWQYLAYDMVLATGSETAMVLPLPVAAGGAEDALEFISLERYPQLFDDLQTSFGYDGGDMGQRLLGPVGATLKVHDVGAFEASYVPRQRDFDRLDSRFRLPDAIWHDLPVYRNDGFAVFRLKRGDDRVHPMAFRFRTRGRSCLYFPTVHVHDLRVQPWADFDHALYAQGSLATNRDWALSDARLGQSMHGDAAGVVLSDEFGYRRLLYGVYENRDTRLALA